MIILHGDHTPHSRQKLVELLDAAKSQTAEVKRYQASELSLADLEQALGESSLFGSQPTIVIEELHSLPPSKKKEALIAHLATVANDQASPSLILWEKRTLTKPMLKKFGAAQVQEFKISNTVFAWLDSLNGTRDRAGAKPNLKHQLQLLHEATQAEDAFYCLIMAARQIRLLIQVKDGGSVGGAPFMIAKLQKQAQSFSLPQLLAAHHRLLELDLAHKTSASSFSLAQDLDLFLLHL
jgi:DNA polymerase III delta subunit